MQWLTIPVYSKSRLDQKINEAIISNKNWNRKHWHAIAQNYSRASYFDVYEDTFKKIYENVSFEKLVDVNVLFIKTIVDILKIKTKISTCNDFELIDGKTERLVHICKQAQATEYISGPAAQSYLKEDLFLKNNIKVNWIDYSDYQEYNQLYPPFEHNVSIIDLIFNEGPNATKYMKSF